MHVIESTVPGVLVVNGIEIHPGHNEVPEAMWNETTRASLDWTAASLEGSSFKLTYERGD